MGNVSILVGAQWGDEGKGKWIDILSKKSDIVVRYQGGNNAGHTLYIDGQKIVLHQIPSGIFQNKQCALTTGVVINPRQLVEEIEKVSQLVKVPAECLWLSARAHVITPWHIFLDGKRESEAENPIGTTKRGIGPTYEYKASRRGMRLGDYINDEIRQSWIDLMRRTEPGFDRHFTENSADWELFSSAAACIKPFVTDAESNLRKAISSGKQVLIEGAQGALLDINHGTYPYVTSSSTIAGGALGSLGFSPKSVGNVIGVCKAYCTRVGEGPFPTELHDEAGHHLATLGKEFGATTGRPRRCGWFDAVAMRYSKEVNGLDGIVLNKMDILTGLKEIKIAVAYKHPTLGVLTEMPWDLHIFEKCTPIYESVPGFSEDIQNLSKKEDLPKEAIEYIKLVEKQVGCKVIMVGTGVGREDAIFMDESLPAY